VIKHEGNKYILYTKDGSKKLGSYDSREEAEERESQVNYFKRKALIEVSLTITKADVRPDGSTRWRAITSDTNPDNTGEATTLQLFQDWINRVEKGETVDWLPPPRLPFLGISHYPALDGAGEAGITQSMWIRGNRFNAEGVFNQTPLGQALFSAVRGEIDLTAKGNLVEQPIRISAAWWDIQHSHGPFVFTRKSLTDVCPMCEKGQAENKKYLLGQLDHWASTRVPINPRTGLSLTERAMSGKITRRDDAASIVGDEAADELEEKSQSLTGKSEAVLVVKAQKKMMDDDEMESDEEMAEDEKEEGKKEADKKKKVGGSYLTDKAHAFDGAVTLSEAYEHPAQKAFTRLETFALVKRNIEALPESDRLGALSALVDELTDEVQELRTAVEDVYLLQPLGDVEYLEISEDTPMTDYLDTFTDAVQAAREAKATPEEKAALMQKALTDVTNSMRAELAGPADVAQAIKAALAPLSEQLAQLNARLGTQPALAAPVQRSVTAPVINDPAGQPANQLPISPLTGQPSSLTAIARRSVGIY